MTVTPRMSRDYFTSPPIVDLFEADHSSYRIFHEAVWYQSAPAFETYVNAPGARYWVYRNGLFPMTPGIWDLRTVLERDYDRTHLLPTAEFTRAMWAVRSAGVEDWAERFMAMSNARYRVVLRPPEIGLRVGSPKEVAPVAVLEGPPSPRYYLADRMVSASGFEEAVEQFKSEEWTSRSAVVDIAPFKVGAGSLTVLKESPSEIALEVRCEDRCFLVVANTYHRYWRAELEGSEVPLRRANLAYQGVEVPAGRHSLRLRYRNPVVTTGLGISLLVSLALAYLVLQPGFVKRFAAAGRSPTIKS